MSELTPDARKALVSDALKRSGHKFEMDDIENLMLRYRAARQSVYDLAKPVREAELQSGRAPDDKALRSLVMKLFLDQFCKFSRDELLYLLTFMHVSSMTTDLATLESV